jgi:hypothetical protein
MQQTSEQLQDRQAALQGRASALEAARLEAERGAAVLAGGEALAQLHQRADAIERERRDLAAGISALEPQLAEARERERERQQEREQLRQQGMVLCRQRVETAATIDQTLHAVGRWLALASALVPVGHALNLGDGLQGATSALIDRDNVQRAFWAAAPGLAGLLGLNPAGVARRPLALTDGAQQVAQRLQHPPRRAA